eukprot:4109392-Lingulodinium_polyedra.AAC.1
MSRDEPWRNVFRGAPEQMHYATDVESELYATQPCAMDIMSATSSEKLQRAMFSRVMATL